MQAETTTLPLTRRERERRERRRAMLNAARSVFAEKGYQDATLDEIAERAEFGKGTLYNYFEGGKEELLFAIFEDVHEDMCGVVKDFFENEEKRDRPTRDVFHDLFATVIQHFLKNQEVFIILVREAHRMALGGEAESVAYIVRLRERVIDQIEPRVQQAIRAGKLRPLPSRPVAHTIMGNIEGYLMHASPMGFCPDVSSEEPERPSPGQAADFLTTILFDGLLA